MSSSSWNSDDDGGGREKVRKIIMFWDKDLKLADLEDSVNSFLETCNPKDTDVIVTQCSDEEYGPLTTITVVYTPQPWKKADNDDE
jgi:hypothetical protein